MHIIGNVVIYGGLIFSIYSFFIILIGIKLNRQSFVDSGKAGIVAIFFLASLSMGMMLFILGTSQFQYEYVAAYTSTNLPLIFKWTALWAGNAGSLLLWLFLLTLYSFILVVSKNLKKTPMIPYISLVMLGNIIFFYLILAVLSNPFTLSDISVVEGKGLNPMLQAPGMILHPLTLYLGYVGLSVPFSFAIAALLLKNIDSYWIQITRRWTLIAWLFLTLGNIVGGFWAYVELGWGGYWAWDPVENASFMPWLTVTAFLHSVMIQERKGMLKVWNLSLIIISYLLTIFGTFLVRSGILTSVHAFANSTLSLYFLIFLAIAIIISLYILMSRFQLLKHDQATISSFISKESSFLINNLILLGAAFTVFWGTIFPLISEAVKGVKVTVGIPFFESVMPPIFLSLIMLMGVCPLLAWQRSSSKKLGRNFLLPALMSLLIGISLLVTGVQDTYALVSFTLVAFMVIAHILEIVRGVNARRKITDENYVIAIYRLFTRNRRRYGGYIVHIGIAMIAIGIIGSNNFDTEKKITLDRGEKTTINYYDITYQDIGLERKNKNDIVYTTMVISSNGRILKTLKPEKIFYQNWDKPSSEVALYSTWKEDVYIVLTSWETDGKATFLIKINPLMKWIWVGSLVVVLGTIFAIWKGKYGNITPKYKGVQRRVS